MNIEPVKGFLDFTGEEAIKRSKIKRIIENTFELNGFSPAETPVIESEEFVLGDNPNDEAVSERYRLTDKGKRNLALRYEFTFQLKRLAINKKLPFRRYQIGYVFRDEPVRCNRVRQITQCDIDIVGSTIKDEAEILKVFSELLKKLKIEYSIYINNRKLLNEILEEFGIVQKEAVIREIDKLDKLSKQEIKENLKKYNAENILEIFTKPEKYFEKYNSYKEINELKKYCKEYGIEVEFLPFIARGLGYYNGNIFEIKTKKIKETICGGGSYLINQIQSTGISVGIERLSILADINTNIKRVLIISINEDKESIKLSEKIKKNKIPSNVFYNKPSKALEYANSYKIPFVVFVGENEVKSKKFKLKNMISGNEKFLSFKELISEIKKIKDF